MLNKYPFLVLLFPAAVLVPFLIVAFIGWRMKKNAGPPADRPISGGKTTSQRAGGVIFGGIFFLAGAGALIPITILPALRSTQAKSWPTVDGVVTSSSLQTHSDHDGSTYSIDIRYDYVVHDTAYHGTRYDATIGSSSGRSGKEEVVHQYPPGRHIPVFYDPADPASSMLNTHLPSVVYYFTWFPLLFMAIGGGIIFYSLRSGRAGVDRPLSTSRGRTGNFTPLASATGSSSAASSRKSRRTSLIALSIFAVMWNGIIGSIFIASGGTWCLAPFVLIGLVIILVVIYSFLQLFNPVIEFEFANPPARLGQRVEINYKTVGNVMSISQLRIYLEGLEKVTYQQGTNTRTETKVIWKFTLLDTTNKAEMERGKAHVALPIDAMPSFAARHNAFVWQITCQGEIARWPDIKDVTPVQVLPAEVRR